MRPLYLHTGPSWAVDGDVENGAGIRGEFLLHGIACVLGGALPVLFLSPMLVALPHDLVAAVPAAGKVHREIPSSDLPDEHLVLARNGRLQAQQNAISALNFRMQRTDDLIIVGGQSRQVQHAILWCVHHPSRHDAAPTFGGVRPLW
ncbi:MULTISPECIES: hypothetical protein [Actinoalloteichus]|uniref:hypothetical protein n=1 Tax=Actinoalloteichus TaxID=65496 RepID=UPI0012FCAD0E|nr:MULTISPECIES: hypothetical protein [Actinoalloteichus]